MVVSYEFVVSRAACQCTEYIIHNVLTDYLRLSEFLSPSVQFTNVSTVLKASVFLGLTSLLMINMSQCDYRIFYGMQT